MARTTALKIDSADLARAGARLGELTGEELGKVIVTSLNDVIDSAYDLARNRMNAGINVTDDYMRRTMSVEHATAQRPMAAIVARGTLTGISHFKPEQRMQPVLRPNRSRGDPARGIPRGQKTAGVSVEVTRGARKALKSSRVFIAPGLRDTEGNPLVFRREGGSTRSGKDKLQRLLGPSVYQLFAYQVKGVFLEETEEALAETLADQAEAALQKALE
jgi:hypothetical protein